MFRIEKGLNLQKSCEFMVIGLFEQTDPFGQWMNQLDGNLQTQLRTMVRSKDISTKFNAVTIIHTLGLSRIKRFVFVGLGKKENLTKEPLRELLGKVFQTIEKSQGTSLSIAFDSFLTDQITAEVMSHIIGEAFHLALYTFPGYKTKKEKREKNTLHEVTIFTEQDSHFVDTTVKRGEVFGKATNAARMLVNTPSNLLTARDLAQYAKQLAEEYAFRVDILGEEEMEQLGMNAILAVNQGSSQPPQIIVLTYEGNKADHNFIGLVGKGITYDTGGYSLKTKTGMVGMSSDMAGAAAVLGAMEIVGRLKPKQNIIAVIPATDNMISSNSFKPDDVITSLSGKTIEVTNTDAEGRLVLADAITYAKQLGATFLIDVATLTGGVIVALGSDKTGAISNNDELYTQILQASEQAGEMIWRLPLTEKDKEKVRKSKIADLDNSPSREGHAIMGGAFISEFVEDTPWVHLDIAGTATVKNNHPLGPAGATGVMTRTLGNFILNFKREQ